MKSQLSILTLLVLSLLACKKKSSGPSAPVISTEVTLSTNIVHDGTYSLDTVYMVFQVQDKNGDIGMTKDRDSDDKDSSRIYFRDDVGGPPAFAPFPEIPSELLHPTKGVVASCTLSVPAAQYLFMKPVAPGQPPHTMDSTRFDIYVRDDAGNISNVVTTPYIYILP